MFAKMKGGRPIVTPMIIREQKLQDAGFSREEINKISMSKSDTKLALSKAKSLGKKVGIQIR